MPLTMIAPTKSGNLAIILVLQDVTLERMKRHDPLEFVTALSGIEKAHVESIVVAYATDEEIAKYEELATKGGQKEILDMIFRGWEIQPGDSDGEYIQLNRTKTDRS